ncbi:SMI1/KNR4 family protein [Streptomyces prunicolor]|uniref:SMI1/KNR4 family protein n=1 Tax=Streptomyces prunicolor TaxID=67348 RepID=UPI003F4DF02F
MTDSRDPISVLLSLCPPPQDGGAGEPLARTEETLGRRLPDSYHRLVEAYGTGCFDEFIWLYGNSPENNNLDIWHRSQKARRVFLRSASVNLNLALSGLGASRDDIISWGGTDNGDLCIWVAVGPSDQWPILVVDVREDICIKFDGNVTEFLLAFLQKDVTSDIFPDDFPSANPEFSRNPYSGA